MRSSSGSFNNAGYAGFNGGYGYGPNDMQQQYPSMPPQASQPQQQQHQQHTMQQQSQQQPVQQSHSQQQAKSGFGLDDLNFDPDTLIGGPEGATGEQTDFGNVSRNFAVILRSPTRRCELMIDVQNS